MTSNHQTVIIGAGVIGLTLGVLLLERQKYGQVIIVSEHLPSTDHTDYCSSKAGGHWRSMAQDQLHQEYDTLTYKTFENIVKNKLSPFVQSSQVTELFVTNTDSKLPWFHQLTPNFKKLTKEELGNKYEAGYTYSSFIINTVPYLNWLMDQFISKGGKIVCQKLATINESVKLFPGASIVVNCTGLGSKTFVGVEDQSMYPIRGQVLLIKAPHIKRSVMVHTGDDANACYMIPKGDGTVVLGGTKYSHDASITVDQSISKDIIDRCNYHMEELKDGNYEIIKQYCGLRPGRKSGVRCEVELIENTSDQKSPLILAHLYGHGGFGFQSSWGSCQKLIEKLDSFVNSTKLEPKL